MKMPIYALRDKLSTEFLFPAPDSNEYTAKRSFARGIKEGNGMISFRPSDYDLYMVGTYDSKTAQFESCVPEFVCNGQDLVDYES